MRTTVLSQRATTACNKASVCVKPQAGALVPRSVLCRAGGEGGIGEDVLARLRAAEEEAARLRKELEAAQTTQAGGKPDVLDTKSKARVDSTDKRETIFAGGQRSAWLSEKDVDFFTGGGPGESTSAPEDPEAAATVQRRLLIGGLLSAGLAAFALVPTESLVIKPSKPMFFYLVPVLRIEQLLNETKQVVDDAQWDQLRTIISRIRGQPNNARENLDAVIALIEDTKTSEKARLLAADFFEYLDSMDYDKYFDSMTAKKKVISGVQNAQFVDFSSRALKVAQQRLAAFIALCPADAVATARQQIEAVYSS